jgi:hypothetical protein
MVRFEECAEFLIGDEVVAIDQAQVLDFILRSDDPIDQLDRMINPAKYEEPDTEDEIAEAEREYEVWRREQAIKRSQRRAKEEGA